MSNFLISSFKYSKGLTETRLVTEGVSNLDAFGIWSLGLRVRAGLQGFVEMVDGLAGGIFHRQQTVISHPAAVKSLGLWVRWRNVRELRGLHE